MVAISDSLQGEPRRVVICRLIVGHIADAHGLERFIDVDDQRLPRRSEVTIADVGEIVAERDNLSIDSDLQLDGLSAAFASDEQVVERLFTIDVGRCRAAALPIDEGRYLGIGEGRAILGEQDDSWLLPHRTCRCSAMWRASWQPITSIATTSQKPAAC